MSDTSVVHRAVASFLFALSLALAFPASADPTHLVGSASITDGDTIRIGGERVRLFGIDAPERDQVCQHADGTPWKCGADATRALATFIGEQEIECSGDERDQYGRLVAVCTAGGQNVGAWMVVQGWALAYRRYSDRYIDEEAAAQAARRGLWAGSFVAPWEWRNSH